MHTRRLSGTLEVSRIGVGCTGTSQGYVPTQTTGPR